MQTACRYSNFDRLALGGLDLMDSLKAEVKGASPGEFRENRNKF